MGDLAMTQLFVLTLENCDVAAEYLEEVFADALDGEIPVVENQPIVVSLDEPDDEVKRLRARVTALLEANNAELERRRRFEAEANQAHCEAILLRNECIRLRDANSALSSFIEECHTNSGEDVPEDGT
jgi:hypothetical protein